MTSRIQWLLLRREKKLVVIRISPILVAEIKKKFSETEGNKILDTLESLEENPHKGKLLTSVAGYVIKEVKHKKWRFYCVTDGHILRFGTEDQLLTLIIKFVKLSDQKDQQKAIDAIKTVLQSMGFEKL